MDTPAIETLALTRTFRRPRRWRGATRKGAPNGEPESDQLIALSGVDLRVPRGELFGLLGPNGAGKTTLIKILTTLLAPTSGQARIQGYDVVTQTAQIRPQINMVSGGESCGYGVLTVSENLWLFAQIYGVSYAETRRRIDTLLDVVGLGEKRHVKVSHLSTGQRQKMNFCRGFLTQPHVLFLDEPTLGLDVNAARTIRQFIRDWMREDPSRTLLLTTHYLTEADELCDRLAIIDRGTVLACDTPQALKRTVQQSTVFELTIALAGGVLPQAPAMAGVEQLLFTPTPEAIHVRGILGDESAIGAIVSWLVEQQCRILTLTKVEPTLEDAFISLVGRGIDEGVVGYQS